jgi:hypothetical protein
VPQKGKARESLSRGLLRVVSVSRVKVWLTSDIEWLDQGCGECGASASYGIVGFTKRFYANSVVLSRKGRALVRNGHSAASITEQRLGHMDQDDQITKQTQLERDSASSR